MSERDERIADIQKRSADWMLGRTYNTVQFMPDIAWLIAELRSAQRALDENRAVIAEIRNEMLAVGKSLRAGNATRMTLGRLCARLRVMLEGARADAPVGSTDLTRNPDGSVRMSTDFPGQPFGPGDTITIGPAVPSRETSEPATCPNCGKPSPESLCKSCGWVRRSNRRLPREPAGPETQT